MDGNIDEYPRQFEFVAFKRNRIAYLGEQGVTAACGIDLQRLFDIGGNAVLVGVDGG